MSDVVIKVENLSKRYSIQHHYNDGFRHVIQDLATAQLRWLRGGVRSWLPGFMTEGFPQTVTTQCPAPVVQPSALDAGEVSALRDVSFEVKRGEVIGIIGRNGAGKSTLLKILSRITEPTLGRVRIRGRVASLLEVGTGFHPELTGRENVFVNGAILGMTRSEVNRKFDEIVDFAEIKKFLDMPVKKYSSGMQVRLAFAVAAHLEPEILVVDEVLAVGDVAFREKCLKKMNEVSHSRGRTVIFVSHDMSAVQSLCQSALVLNEGRLVFDGPVHDATRHYLKTCVSCGTVNDLTTCTRTGTGEARITSVRFENDEGALQEYFCMGEPLNVIVRAMFPSKIKNPTFGVNILTDTGVMVADCRSSHYGFHVGVVKGEIEYRMRIESVALYPRTYFVEPWLADASCLADIDWVRNGASFIVTTGANFKAGASINSDHGISYIPTTWTAKVLSEKSPEKRLMILDRGI